MDIAVEKPITTQRIKTLVAAQPEQERRTAILVLGMHRSGTSALSRALSILGCDLPRTLMKASRNNPAGYWESQAVARLNDRILESAGTSWDDWVQFNPRWFLSPKAPEFRLAAKALLEEEFGASGLFVLKDPRICRIPAFWIDSLKECGLRPAVVLISRNPLEVAASLQARNGFQPEFTYLMWLRHVLDAEAGTRGMKRLVLTYDRLLRERWSALERADEELGFVWPRLSEKARAEIDNFLDAGLRHYRREDADVLAGGEFCPWGRQVYEIFSRWAREGGESASDYLTLDALREQLDAATPAVSQIIAAGRRTASDLLRVTNKLSALSDESSALESRLSALRDEHSALRDEHSAMEAAHAHDRCALEDSNAKLEAAVADLDEQIKNHAQGEAQLRDALEGEKREKEKLHSELTSSTEHAARLDVARRTLEERLSASALEADGLREEMCRTRIEVETLRSEVNDAGQRLAATERRLSESEGKLKEQVHKRTALEGELIAARQMADSQKSESERLAASYKEHVQLLMTSVSDRDASIVVLRRENASLKEEAAAFADAYRTQRAQSSERSRADSSQKAFLRQQLHAAAAKTAHMRIVAAHQLAQLIAVIGPRTKLPLMSRLQRRRQVAWLRRSGVFDAEWYLSAYPDVAAAGIDPARHYVEAGALEGRQPSGALVEALAGPAEEASSG